jgi:hypothetical protein
LRRSGGTHTGLIASLPEPLARYTIRADSLTASARFQSRNISFFALLALIVNSLGPEHQPVNPERGSAWLDQLGPDGVSALQGRWAWRVLRRHLRQLDRPALARLLKLVAYHGASIIRNCRQEWWTYSASPADVAGVCANETRI